jgi:uncharacterized protein HemX
MIRTVVIALLALAFALACASTPEPKPTSRPIVKTQPAPSQPVAEAQLPKTASPLPLIGLAGLAALGLGAATRVVRRRL